MKPQRHKPAMNFFSQIDIRIRPDYRGSGNTGAMCFPGQFCDLLEISKTLAMFRCAATACEPPMDFCFCLIEM